MKTFLTITVLATVVVPPESTAAPVFTPTAVAFLIQREDRYETP